MFLVFVLVDFEKLPDDAVRVAAAGYAVVGVHGCLLCCFVFGVHGDGLIFTATVMSLWSS